MTVRIAALNDFHGGLYEKQVKGDATRARGGLPILKAAIDTLRAEDPELVLLDGGDLFQGAWPVNQTKGRGSVLAYDMLGVDAASIGNHEFDYGAGSEGSHPLRGALEDAAASANFSWLAANIYKDGQRWNPPGTKPWTILERKGVKLGVIGVTTTDTPQTTLLANVVDLEFRDPVAEIQAVLPELGDVDAVIVVGHLTGHCEPKTFGDPGPPCLPNDEIGSIVQKVPEVDVLVMGHAHTVMAHRWNDTFVMENRSGGQMVGRLDLVIGPDGVDADASTMHPPWELVHDAIDPGCTDAPYPVAPIEVGGRTLTPSAEAVALVKSLEEESGSLCSRVGCTEAGLGRSRSEESAAGNLMADAMLSQFPEADFAIQNSGGVRSDLPIGELRVEHIQQMMPFDNRMLMLELTGAEVELLFRLGSSGAHGILQVSGASYGFDPGKTSGSDVDGNGEIETWEHDRLCSVEVGGAPLDPERTYKVVTTDFLRGGGDHLGPALSDKAILADRGLLREGIVRHVEQLEGCIGDLKNPARPRIRIGPCG